MGSPERGRATLLFALVALVAGLVACNGASEAADVKTIGMLRVVVDDDHDAFVDELRNQGWRLGADVRILPTDPERTYDLDTARSALRAWEDADVDLIVAFSTSLVDLVVEQVPDTPALFLVNDPVSAGFVSDPVHPDGQLTGVTFRTPTDRTLDLARRLLGGELDRLGYLAPADDPAVPGHRGSVVAAADEADVQVVDATFADVSEVPAAVAALERAGVDAVMLANASGTLRALDELDAALEEADLPVVASSDLVRFAVLVVTPDGAETRRQLARQASRLLAGAHVRAVPVEDPRKFVVIIDRIRARRLGLPAIDPALLRQADVVR